MTVQTSKVFAKPSGPKKSRLEMNIRQLLNKCELIAKQEPLEGNWRLKKYVEALCDMITELKTGPDKPAKDVLAEYSKRASFLKGIIQTATLTTPIEKLEAVQQLSHGSATMSADAAAQEIHQKTVVKYGVELRTELFGLEDSDDSLRKRNIIKAPNFTSNAGGQEDMDSLLKYHQNMQEKVAENMVMLTKSLKEQSQIASTIIRQDTEVSLGQDCDTVGTLRTKKSWQAEDALAILTSSNQTGLAKALKKSTELTDRNMMSLKVESDRLQEHSRSAWKCWLWLMLAVVMAIFINMVLFMKVMKKRKVDV